MSKPKPKKKEPKTRVRTRTKAKAPTKVKAKVKKRKPPEPEPRAKARAEAKSKPAKPTKRSGSKPVKKTTLSASKAKPKAKAKTKPKAKVQVKVKVKPTKAKTKTKTKPKAAPRPRKRKKPVAVKRVFEGRPRKFQPSEVVEPEPGATSQEEAFATIQARLEDAKRLLPEGLKATIRIHPYADGSVDGELHIKVPEDSRSGDTSWELMDSFGAITLGQRYWVSVGANFIIEADEQVYRRFRGMNLVQTNYQRAVKANIVEEGLILRKTILPGMARKHKHEAHSVFIRLHWNPANEHPKR